MDTTLTKRRRIEAVDRFSTLPVALLHVIFRFCLLQDLLCNVTVCKAWLRWISNPAALPTEAHYRNPTTDSILDWLGRCGVRWPWCGAISWIDRGPFPAESLKETWLGENDVIEQDALGEESVLHRCRGRLQLDILRWQGGDRGRPTPAQWEKVRFLFAGLHTLVAMSLVPAEPLFFCEALRNLHIELDGDVEWIPLIQALPNQRFRICVRVESDRSAEELLDKVKQWAALRDRIDELTLVVNFREGYSAFNTDKNAFTQILQLQLPLVRLYVRSTGRMAKMPVDEMPHLQELFWQRWHVCGRAHVETFLRLLNAVYVE